MRPRTPGSVASWNPTGARPFMAKANPNAIATQINCAIGVPTSGAPTKRKLPDIAKAVSAKPLPASPKRRANTVPNQPPAITPLTAAMANATPKYTPPILSGHAFEAPARAARHLHKRRAQGQMSWGDESPREGAGTPQYQAAIQIMIIRTAVRRSESAALGKAVSGSVGARQGLQASVRAFAVNRVGMNMVRAFDHRGVQVRLRARKRAA